MEQTTTNIMRVLTWAFLLLIVYVCARCTVAMKHGWPEEVCKEEAAEQGAYYIIPDDRSMFYQNNVVRVPAGDGCNYCDVDVDGSYLRCTTAYCAEGSL